MNTLFIKQRIRLIKSDCEYIYNVTNYFYFKYMFRSSRGLMDRALDL